MMIKKNEDIFISKDLTAKNTGNVWHNNAAKVSHLAAIFESSENAIARKSLDGIIKTRDRGLGFALTR